jgi:hypothetical protein
MKKIMLVITGVLISCLTFSQDPGWPRQFTNNGSVLVVYPPQVEDWQAYQTIDFRMAFSLKPVNQAKQVVGVVYINAATNNDTYTHMVSISNMKITSVHFPSLDPATDSECFHGKNCRLHTQTAND